VNNPIKVVPPSPVQNPAPKVNPVTNPPVQPNKQPDFTNFFGKTDPKLDIKP
jgi:hypothetical protein